MMTGSPLRPTYRKSLEVVGIQLSILRRHPKCLPRGHGQVAASIFHCSRDGFRQRWQSENSGQVSGVLGVAGLPTFFRFSSIGTPAGPAARVLMKTAVSITCSPVCFLPVGRALDRCAAPLLVGRTSEPCWGKHTFSF